VESSGTENRKNNQDFGLNWNTSAENEIFSEREDQILHEAAHSFGQFLRLSDKLSSEIVGYI
jgi:hypothetical protein